MKKNEVEPVLVAEDEMVFNDQMKSVEKLIPQINEVIKVLQRFDIPCNKINIDFAFKNAGALRDVMMEKAQADTRTIKEGIAKREILESIDGKAKQMIQQIRNLPSVVDISFLRFIELTETGIPVLSDEGTNTIRENARIYVTTERGIAIYKKHIAAREALQELQNELGNKRFDMLNEFFEMGFGDLTVECKPITYDNI